VQLDYIANSSVLLACFALLLVKVGNFRCLIFEVITSCAVAPALC